MTKCFKLKTNKGHRFYALADEEAEARQMTVDSGRCKPEDIVSAEDATEKRIYDYGGLTLKSLLDANRKGIAYKGNPWHCVPLSKDSPGLHDKAQELVPCYCGAQPGQPCNNHDGHLPVKEGTVHRHRVLRLLREHPEVLNAN